MDEKIRVVYRGNTLNAQRDIRPVQDNTSPAAGADMYVLLVRRDIQMGRWLVGRMTTDRGTRARTEATFILVQSVESLWFHGGLVKMGAIQPVGRQPFGVE